LLKDKKKLHEKDVILEKIINHINTNGFDTRNLENSSVFSLDQIKWVFTPTV
jgi:isochorismate synthase EntC